MNTVQTEANNSHEPITPKNPVDELTRTWLLERLGEILQIAMGRVTAPKTPSEDRIKWSRIVIAAGQACNTVLRDEEIESLKEQINELKELTMAKLTDEQAEPEEGDSETSADS